VKSYGYDAPFIPMIVLLMISMLLWFRIDPAQDVISEAEPMGEMPSTLLDFE
jgi:hypothetical protein